MKFSCKNLKKKRKKILKLKNKIKKMFVNKEK